MMIRLGLNVYNSKLSCMIFRSHLVFAILYFNSKSKIRSNHCVFNVYRSHIKNILAG